MAYELNEQKKVGLGLIGFGIFFSFLGVLLFFDRGLLALGNIFWLTGVAILLGWNSTWKLFTNRANYKGSVSFLLGLFFIFVRFPIVGIILEIYGRIYTNYGSVSFLLGLFFIFVRFPIVGIILEIYGCIALFGGFWPSVKVFLYQIPIVGWIVQYPILLLDRLGRASS